MNIERYLEIQKRCTVDSNTFLHESKVSPDKFRLEDFIEESTDKRKIKRISHSFSTNKIIGALQSDEIGTSILINSSVDKFAQNLGSTHELSHDSLHLNRVTPQSFSDGVNNLYKDSQILIEQEANTCGMFYFIPDISLYSVLTESKVVYSDLLQLFRIEDWLLTRRIERYLQLNCQLPFNEAETILKMFKEKTRFQSTSMLQEIIAMDIFSNPTIQMYQETKKFNLETNVRSDFNSYSLSVPV